MRLNEHNGFEDLSDFRIGMKVEIPVLKEERKIKSMQRWKTEITSANMGDRAALLFQNVSTSDIDRTVIFEPGALRSVKFVLVNVESIKHFKGELNDRTKLHISSGFEIVMAVCQFLALDSNDEYEVVPKLYEDTKFAILSLEKEIYARENSFYLASKLDEQGKGCRFAFYGKFLRLLENETEIKRFKRKRKTGKVERIENETNLICSSMFKKESKVDIYSGMKVYLTNGEVGLIEGAFGKSGKIRIHIPDGILEKTLKTYKIPPGIEVQLFVKKYVNDGTLKASSPIPAE